MQTEQPPNLQLISAVGLIKADFHPYYNKGCPTANTTTIEKFYLYSLVAVLNPGDVNFVPSADYVGTADCGIPAINDFFLLDVDGLPGGSISRYAPCVAPYSIFYAQAKTCPISSPSDQIILAYHNKTFLDLGGNGENQITHTYFAIVKFPLTQIQYDHLLTKAGKNITAQLSINPAVAASTPAVLNLTIPSDIASVQWKSNTTGEYLDTIYLGGGSSNKTEFDLPECLDGDMLVPTLHDGNKKVSSLQLGDKISGVKNQNMEQSWCEVKAIHKTSSLGITFGGFTKNHFVVYPDSSNPSNNLVAMAGTNGKLKPGALYDLLTDCDATYNAEGTLFTPTSGDVCPTLSWTDYITVLGGFRSVMVKTGPFWSDVQFYHDNATYTRYGGSYKGALHDLCLETLQCAKLKSCDQFEDYANSFLRSHLRSDKLAEILSIFPRLGSVSTTGNVNGYIPGTLSATVSGKVAAV